VGESVRVLRQMKVSHSQPEPEPEPEPDQEPEPEPEPEPEVARAAKKVRKSTEKRARKRTSIAEADQPEIAPEPDKVSELAWAIPPETWRAPVAQMY